MSQPLDSLPDLAQEYPLSPEQVAAFQRDGHILLRGVASQEEVAAYRPFIAEAVARRNRETRPLEERDTYARAFIQITNLWEEDAVARRFVMARRFARIAADLMGVKAVRLYHDQALFKEAGGGHTPWHQDQYYWPLDTNNTITMWMPLVNASTGMGTMTFASNSHKLGSLGELPISDESEEIFRKFVSEHGLHLTHCGAMSAGDATFHYGWTLHSAPGNSTDRMREVMTIIYFEDGARLLKPDHEHRRADLERWHPGQKPGELAASPLNPLLCSR